MKNYTVFNRINKLIAILFIVGLLTSSAIFAKQVDIATAKQVGANYLKEVTYEPAGDLRLIYTSASTDKATVYFYIFGTDHSFVIVSGDDQTIPVLGYSDETTFNTNRIAPSLNYMLTNYSTSASYIISNNIAATPEIMSKWTALISGSVSMNKSGTSVLPLLKTTWDQAPFYNDLCPYDNPSGELTVTGCVATAMAQVLKYWNYPQVGLGSYTYDDNQYGYLSASFSSTTYAWDSMPKSVTSVNNAVATLMYHCGVAINMHYGTAETGGSSAYVISDHGKNPNSAEDALKNYFGYAKTLKGFNRSAYSDADWITMLNNELINKRPVIYSGFEQAGGGHCFVFDGFQSLHSTFHVNWGWGGYNNGYFAVSALNPPGVGIGGGSGDFNLNQAAIIGIQPADGAGIETSHFATGNMNAFPNPAKDIFTLNISDPTAKLVNVTIFNSEGQQVYSEIPGINKTSLTISTSTLPNGIYLVKVNSDKGLWSSKIVIEK